MTEVMRSAYAQKRGIDNRPGSEGVRNALRLVYTCAQPARTELGEVFDINSWHRNTTVNRGVGGSNNSDHLYCRAIDFTVRGMTTAQAYRRIKAMGLPIKQLILEFPDFDWSWIHLSCTGIGERINPARQWLVINRENNRRVTHPFKGSRWDI